MPYLGSMDKLAEKVDDLLITQGDLFVEQLRDLIADELGVAVARQLAPAQQTPLWPLAGTQQQCSGCPCCSLRR